MSHSAPISVEIAKRQSKRAQKFLNEKGFDVSLALAQEMTAQIWGFRTFQGFVGTCAAKCPSAGSEKVARGAGEPTGASYQDRWIVTEENIEEHKRNIAFLVDYFPIVVGCECWLFSFGDNRRGSITVWPDGKVAIWFGEPTAVQYGRWLAAKELIVLNNHLIYHVDGKPEAGTVKVEISWSPGYLGLNESQMACFKSLFVQKLGERFNSIVCVFVDSPLSSAGVADARGDDRAPEELKGIVFSSLGNIRREIMSSGVLDSLV